jgi:hypothetical protein
VPMVPTVPVPPVPTYLAVRTVMLHDRMHDTVHHVMHCGGTHHGRVHYSRCHTGLYRMCRTNALHMYWHSGRCCLCVLLSAR